MRSQTVLGVLAAATFVAAAGGQPVRMAAIGDSLTDEYAEETYGPFGRSWPQILVDTGRADFGPTAAQAGVGYWGEPRRTGYRDNWARYAATNLWAIESGQHTGAAAAAVNHGARYVVMFIGGNDFGSGAAGIYNRIYFREWTQAQVDAFMDEQLNHYRTMLSALAATEAKVVLVSTLDFSFMPLTWAGHPSVIDRGRVETQMARWRDRVRRLAMEQELVFLDLFELNRALFRTNTGFPLETLIGNVPVVLLGHGQTSESAFVPDTVHPQTVIQAVWARAIVTALNAGYDAGIAEITEQEAVTIAGLTYGGADTLPQILRPMPQYVQNFACIADFNSDGQVSVQDVLDFVGDYFAGDVRADFDATPGPSIGDIFAYLGAYFANCP